MRQHCIIWGRSSAGRALEWHSRGHRFDPDRLHQMAEERVFRFSVIFSKRKGRERTDSPSRGVRLGGERGT